MDFDLVPDADVAGYRIAPITLIERGQEPTGDAWLLCPDGTHIDVYWKAEEPAEFVVWHPSEIEGGRGVIEVRLREAVSKEGDLDVVLRLAAKVVDDRSGAS